MTYITVFDLGKVVIMFYNFTNWNYCKFDFLELKQSKNPSRQHSSRPTVLLFIKIRFTPLFYLQTGGISVNVIVFKFYLDSTIRSNSNIKVKRLKKILYIAKIVALSIIWTVPLHWSLNFSNSHGSPSGLVPHSSRTA